MQLLAGLVDTHGFEVLDALAAAQPLKNCGFLRSQLGRNQNSDGAPDGLFGSESENAAGTGVPTRDDAVEVFGNNGIVGRGDDRGKAALCFVSSPPFRDVL